MKRSRPTAVDLFCGAGGMSLGFEQAGFEIVGTERLSKEFEFQGWADRQRVSAADKLRLLDMMRQMPPALEPLFAPRWADDTMYFSLWEVVLVGRKR